MENPEHNAGEATETFAKAIQALKDAYGVSDSEVARRLEAHGAKVSIAAVNTWVHGKRVPRATTIRALAEVFPKFPAERLLAAAGKRAPAPQTADEREETLRILDRMTKEQRRLLMIQARAVADSNE